MIKTVIGSSMFGLVNVFAYLGFCLIYNIDSDSIKIIGVAVYVISAGFFLISEMNKDEIKQLIEKRDP